MTKDEYTEKLKDPRWQKKRLEIFEGWLQIVLLFNETWKQASIGNYHTAIGAIYPALRKVDNAPNKIS